MDHKTFGAVLLGVGVALGVMLIALSVSAAMLGDSSWQFALAGALTIGVVALVFQVLTAGKR